MGWDPWQSTSYVSGAVGAGSKVSGLSGLLGGAGAGIMGALGPIGLGLGALSFIVSLFSAQKAKEEAKRRRQQAMALQAWQALDEPWRSPRYGGGY